MSRKNGHSLLQGAMILTGATMLVKVISMFYKIPLGNILGAGGMAHFSSAYSIFNPILALSIAGFPVAVSKLVSEQVALNRYRDIRRIYRVSLVLFLCTGLIGTFVMLFGARFFAGLIDNPDAALSIAVMAPAVLFCCVMSAFRGYFQGMRNMVPTAVSQVLEALVKLICGVWFAWMFLQRGLDQYASTGMVYGRAADSLEQAQLLAAPHAAAGAVLGVTLSTVAGALYLMLRKAVRGDSVTREQLKASPAPRRKREVISSLIRIALPVCLAAAVGHISTLVDVATIMNRVGVAISRDAVTVLEQYAAWLPESLSIDQVPSWLFGAYSYTNSLFNLVPAVTVALGISALPNISSQWMLNREQAARNIASVVKISSLIAIPAGLGLAALAEPILSLLYASRPAEVAVAAPLLEWMGVAAVFAGITTPLMSIFQAVGRVDLPVKLMAAGALVKILANWYLLAIPGLNIGAAPFGTILCYVCILIGGLIALRGSVGVKIPYGKTFFKPAVCGILCALAAHTTWQILVRILPSVLATLLAVIIGILFYLAFILFLKVISQNEALMLPNGKKVVKILEKLGFLG